VPASDVTPLDLVPGTFLAHVADVPADRGLPLRVGTTSIFIHRWADGFVAYVNRCPHIGTPLDLVPGRLLSAEGNRFICATHYAEFDPASGLCTKGPCKGKRLQPVLLSVRDDSLIAA
jgi:nitrite reductase/ring-hydroxylating ferredoxin subunit